VLEVSVYEGKGRVGKDQQAVPSYYQISGRLYTPLKKREEATK